MLYEVAMRDDRYLRKLQWRCIAIDQGFRLKTLPLRGNRLFACCVLLTRTPLCDDTYILSTLLAFIAASAAYDPLLHNKLLYSEETCGKWSQSMLFYVGL